MTLRVDQLAAGFDGREVIADVSFGVGPGELVTVLGESGSGKTTLLRAIAGLHPVTRGRVLLSERDVTAWPAERRRVGLVPQEGALFPHRTAAANIGYGVARADRRERVAQMLDLVGLSDRGAALPHELSGGQRQRIALARALAPAPPVLLLDEPFSSLDAAMRAALRMEFARIVAETATSAVLVTHDVAEALAMSDRIVVVDAGRVLAVGAPHELYRRPPSAAVAQKLGPASFLDAEPADPGRVRTALGVIETVETLSPSRHALVRPEQLRLTDAGDQGRGRVLWSQFRGDCHLVSVQLDAGPILTAQTPASQPWKPGDDVSVQVSEPVWLLPGEPHRAIS